MGTQATTWTISAIFDRELDLDHLILVPVESRRPANAGLTFWTGGALSLPIHLKVGCIKARLLLGLPFVIGSGRTKQIDPIGVLATVEQLCINLARIHNVLLRQQVLVL